MKPSNQPCSTDASKPTSQSVAENIRSLSGDIELEGIYLKILLDEIVSKLDALNEGAERMSNTTLAAITAINCFVSCAASRVDSVLDHASKILTESGAVTA